jgi:hypothetical protein
MGPAYPFWYDTIFRGLPTTFPLALELPFSQLARLSYYTPNAIFQQYIGRKVLIFNSFSLSS